MNGFDELILSPMLIGAVGEPFDSSDYLFELKLDGLRGLAYLGDRAELRNKRAVNISPAYPELTNIFRQVRRPCVLDGEIAAMVDGKPSFAEVQRRSILSAPFKIQLAAAQHPVSFTAFDLLWLDGEDLTGEPLERRKELLREVVAEETPQLAVSRAVPEQGRALCALTEARGLEGVVAKRLGSRYYPGKRTKDWIKIKHLLDEDFVVCGFIRKAAGMTSLVLGQYRDGALHYKGHVTLGVSGSNYRWVAEAPRQEKPPFPVPRGNEGAVWIVPELVCTVSYMEKSERGVMRQPVYKGLRDDKAPEECMVQTSELV